MRQRVKPLKKDALYTVTQGRLKGLTGRAISSEGSWEIHKLWFSELDQPVSFLNACDHLRPATDKEIFEFFQATH
jgi:hypothetical protein